MPSPGAGAPSRSRGVAVTRRPPMPGRPDQQVDLLRRRRPEPEASAPVLPVDARTSAPSRPAGRTGRRARRDLHAGRVEQPIRSSYCATATCPRRILPLGVVDVQPQRQVALQLGKLGDHGSGSPAGSTAAADEPPIRSASTARPPSATSAAASGSARLVVPRDGVGRPGEQVRARPSAPWPGQVGQRPGSRGLDVRTCVAEDVGERARCAVRRARVNGMLAPFGTAAGAVVLVPGRGCARPSPRSCPPGYRARSTGERAVAVRVLQPGAHAGRRPVAAQPSSDWKQPGAVTIGPSAST